MTLAAHQPFTDRQTAIKERKDLMTQRNHPRQTKRITVRQTILGSNYKQKVLVCSQKIILSITETSVLLIGLFLISK